MPRAFYACRSSSCIENLGVDDVCVADEAAFRAAESTDGACLVSAGPSKGRLTPPLE
jgi:hypothetical protein